MPQCRSQWLQQAHTLVIQCGITGLRMVLFGCPSIVHEVFEKQSSSGAESTVDLVWGRILVDIKGSAGLLIGTARGQHVPPSSINCTHPNDEHDIICWIWRTSVGEQASMKLR